MQVVPAQGLTQFQAQQGETARIHGQYLQNEQSYVQAFTQLTQSSLNLLSNGDLNPGQFEQLVSVLQGLERSMEQFHAHQAETLRVHEQYLKGQESFTQSFARLLEQGGVTSNGSGNGHHAPAPTCPDPSPHAYGSPIVEEPAIWDLATNGNGNGKSAATQPKPEARPAVVNAPPAPTPAPARTAAAVQAVTVAPAAPAAPERDLTQVFLEIVSEKTGYPIEMLELDMDMEADLGIDSIKRVEILGAVREQYPDLPKVDPEAFAEMRTLRQVAEHVEKTLPAGGKGVGAGLAPAQAAAPAQTAAPASTPAQPAVEAVGDLTEAFLAVVSDKTGYPTEMLELDMDMEADLGIDSIKRVEILSGVREQHPDLPKLAPEAFAELRTLRQIIAAYSAPSELIEANPVPAQTPASDPEQAAAAPEEKGDTRVAPIGGPGAGLPERSQREDRLSDRDVGAGHGHGSGPGDRLDQAGRGHWRDAGDVPRFAEGGP